MSANSNCVANTSLEAVCKDASQRRLLSRRKHADRAGLDPRPGHGVDLAHAPLRMELLVMTFRNGRLDPVNFGHAELLVITSWYLHQQAPDEALDVLLGTFRELEFDRARAGAAVFSETKLTFWLHVVRRFLESEGSDGAWQKDAAGVLQFYGRARRLPYRYYSAKRWNSIEARYKWLLPDLRPFPEAGRL